MFNTELLSANTIYKKRLKYHKPQNIQQFPLFYNSPNDKRWANC